MKIFLLQNMVRADIFIGFFGSFCLAKRGDFQNLAKFSLAPAVGFSAKGGCPRKSV